MCCVFVALDDMICTLIALDNDCYIYKITVLTSNQINLYSYSTVDRRPIKPRYYATTTKTLEVFFFFSTLVAAWLPTILTKIRHNDSPFNYHPSSALGFPSLACF